MAIYDVFTYNGERDILNLHLNILENKVDKFIICEAKTTFSGKKKPLYFMDHEQYFKRFWKKIEYFVIDEDYTYEEIKLAENSPNTQGAAHWKREFLQKESVHKAIRGCQEDDILYIGDVDEIWEPIEVTTPQKLKLRVYAYYLDNRSNEEFWGTLATRYKDIKNEVLNHVRTDTSLRTPTYHGWHFTSMGGVEEVRRKLNDSYTKESYNRGEVQVQLKGRVEAGTDYLGREFTFKLDESEWPQYLKENKIRYQSLCKTENV